MRATAEDTKQALIGFIKEHAKRRDALKPEVDALAAELESRRAALLRNPQATALEALEARLRIAEQNVFQLREYIADKSRSSDYSGLKLDVVRLVGELNLLLQRNQSKMAGSVPALAGSSGAPPAALRGGAAIAAGGGRL